MPVLPTHSLEFPTRAASHGARTNVGFPTLSPDMGVTVHTSNCNSDTNPGRSGIGATHTKFAPAAPVDLSQPLTVPCARCTDGQATTNDPSSARECPSCDGTGERELTCESCGEFGAEVWLHGLAMHAACAERERVGAFSVAEDAA